MPVRVATLRSPFRKETSLNEIDQSKVIIKTLSEDNTRKQAMIEQRDGIIERYKKSESDLRNRLNAAEKKHFISQSQVEMLLDPACWWAKEMIQYFPDVHVPSDRWGAERYSSASVTEDASHVDIGHSCGCCPDSSIYARPYLIFQPVNIPMGALPCNIKIFNPNYLCIGERSYYPSETLSEGWENQVREAGFSEKIVKQIREWHASATKDDEPPEDEDHEDGETGD